MGVCETGNDLDGFSPVLCAQFAHECKNFTAYCFEAILTFLNEVIANLQFKKRRTRYISIIIGEENSTSSNKKLNIRRKSTAYRVNNLQDPKLATAVSPVIKTAFVWENNGCELAK